VSFGTRTPKVFGPAKNMGRLLKYHGRQRISVMHHSPKFLGQEKTVLTFFGEMRVPSTARRGPWAKT